MKINHLEYKGKKILAINYFECQTIEESLQLLKDLEQEFRKSIEPVLTLEDYTDAHVSAEFMTAAKKLGKEYLVTKRAKGAMLGITGIKLGLLASYNSYTGENLTPFDTKEEGLEYLVS